MGNRVSLLNVYQLIGALFPMKTAKIAPHIDKKLRIY